MLVLSIEKIFKEEVVSLFKNIEVLHRSVYVIKFYKIIYQKMSACKTMGKRE